MKQIIIYTLLFTSLLIASCKQDAKKESDNSRRSENADAFIQTNKTGKDVVYFDNSKQVRYTGDLIKGKRNGLWKAYYENGALWSEGEFKDGLGEGLSHIYYPSGKIKTMGFYSNDKPAGVWQFFDENEKMTHEIDYTQGGKGKLTEY
jgi:antitoxin component YwqK of YwqJK toxin-antitoxin module